jgi:hypothetical protein
MFLDPLFTHVLERDGELVAHLISYHPADADAAWFSQGLKARRDVDTVAKDVVALNNDIAEIDTDAELDAVLGLHAGIARGHLALHVDRAANRVDDTGKLAEQTVACCIDDAAAVLLDLGVGDLSPQRLQRSERAFLVRPHQARITRDVGRQNRCQAPLDLFLCHDRRPYQEDKGLLLGAKFNTVFEGVGCWSELFQIAPIISPAQQRLTEEPAPWRNSPVARRSSFRGMP